MMKVAIIILSEPLTYPPTMNAANIMAEKGWQVDIYGIKYHTSDFVQYNENVHLHYIGQHVTGFKNILQYLRFYFWLNGIFKLSRPAVILSYDPMSVGPAYYLSKKFNLKWLYHVHDLLENAQGWYKIIKWIEIKFAAKAFNISFPQQERAKLYQQELNTNRAIDIVFNGPRKNWGTGCIPHPAILKIKNTFENIVLYQGGISKHFNFDVILKAIDLCKSRFAFCIIGRELEAGSVAYYKSLLKTDRQRKSVYFLEPTCYDKLPSVSSLATIGLAKLTADKNAPVNDFFLIGASNKITEYCAMGLPILFPNTTINSKFLEENNIGLMCDTSSATDLATKIDRILLNKTLQTEMRNKAKSFFDTNLNFDAQFEKLMIKLDKVTA